MTTQRKATRSNNDSSDEPMDTCTFPADQDRPHDSPLATGGEDQLLEALRESRRQNESLRRDLDSEKDENGRLREELAAKDHEIRELAARNEKLRARLDAAHSDGGYRAGEPVESGGLSMEQDPHETSSSLGDGGAANDTAQTATDSGTAAQVESQLEYGDGASSETSILLVDLADGAGTKSNSDADHASKQRKKTRKGPFPCAECGRVFNSKSNRRAHKRIHTGEKPYTCRECGSSFTQFGHLQRHARTHTGEKPYKCEQCGKACADTGNLRKHERIHNPVVGPSKAAKKTASQAHFPSKA